MSPDSVGESGHTREKCATGRSQRLVRRQNHGEIEHVRAIREDEGARRIRPVAFGQRPGFREGIAATVHQPAGECRWQCKRW